MIATKKQMMQHYIDDGMPEIYAFMAVQEAVGYYINTYASATLVCSFVWDNSELGGDFWNAIYSELVSKK